MKRFYILIIIFSYVKSFSQDIQNVNFTFNNNVFYITYDLLNCSSLNTNDIKITFEGKTTGYYTPVNVSGDIFNQSCSTNKKIIWSPLTEGKQIKEEVRFIVEIRENKKLIKNEQSNSNIKEQTLYNNKNVVNNKSLSTIKVAHVNTQKLLDTLPSRKVALSQISDFEKKGVAELKDMEAELQKIYSKYLQDKDKLTPVHQQYEEERIQKKNQAMQQREQELQQQIRSLGEELNSPILKRVQKAVDIIADRKKINYVIDETATIYFKDGIDLTSEVMVELLKLDLNLSNNQTLKKENQINDESKTDEPKKIITVAHVNTQKLLDTMPSRKLALSQISDFEKKGVAELKDMEAELQKIYSKYLQDKDKLTPVVQQYEEERIQNKNQAMQQREQEIQQQIRSLGEELNSPILKRVQKAVDIIADRKKINYVIDETTTIYFKDGIDLTSEVLLELLELDSIELIQKK
jgi:outer membrane protein